MTNMAIDNIKIARNTIYLYIRLLFVMLVSLFTVRVIMRELGEEGVGTFNVVAGFVSMLGFIGTTFTTGIQRFFNIEIGVRGEQAAIEVYSTSLKIMVSAAFMILILFETIGLWYVNNIMNLPRGRMYEINILYQSAIWSLVFNVLVIPFSSFVIAKEHMNWYAVVSIIESIAKLGIAYLLSIFLSNRLAVYGIFLLIIAIFNFFAYLLFCRRLYPWLRYTNQPQENLIKPILIFSGWNTLSSVANIGKGQGVNLVLNYFFGVTINAANAVVTQIYSAVQLFSINICTAFRPQLIESYAQKKYKHTVSMIYIMTKMGYGMVYMLCIPIYLELSYILNLWLGDNIPFYTIEFTRVTLLIILIGSLNTPISIAIYANGNIRSYTIIYSCILLCLPIGYLSFWFGAPAIAIFWIIFILMCIIQFVSLVIMKRRIEYSYKDYIFKVFLPITIFTISAPIVPWMIHNCDFETGFVRFIAVSFSSLIWSILIAFILFLTLEQRKKVISKLRLFRVL